LSSFWLGERPAATIAEACEASGVMSMAGDGSRLAASGEGSSMATILATRRKRTITAAADMARGVRVGRWRESERSRFVARVIFESRWESGLPLARVRRQRALLKRRSFSTCVLQGACSRHAWRRHFAPCAVLLTESTLRGACSASFAALRLLRFSLRAAVAMARRVDSTESTAPRLLRASAPFG
jgi:hypothetical protein